MGSLRSSRRKRPSRKKKGSFTSFPKGTVSRRGSRRVKPRKSRTKRSRSRSRSNQKVLREYERLLFQPLSQKSSLQIPMLPVNESKHQLIKQATYGGYSWNRSRKISKPQLRSFLQEHHVPSSISNPFQKVCGPSKSSIAYPVIYTKDELIRQALSKGHTLEQVSLLTIPKLCDLLDLSGKPIYVKPLEKLSKKLSKSSECHSKTKSHLVRLAVNYGFAKTMAQKATKKDLCDILGLSDTSSKTNALLSTQESTEKTNAFYEVEDASSCSLFSPQGESYCNAIKLRSSGVPACEYDNIERLCKSKASLPFVAPSPKTGMSSSPTLVTQIVNELKKAEQKKDVLEKVLEQSPPSKQKETQKEIDKVDQTIDKLEDKLDQVQDQLSNTSVSQNVPSTNSNNAVQDTISLSQESNVSSSEANKVNPVLGNESLVTDSVPGNKSVATDSEIEEQIRRLSPEDPRYKAYLVNKERYFSLQEEAKAIEEQIRQNQSDIRADESSAADEATKQIHLSKGVQLNSDQAKKQEEILKVSQEMRKQLQTMRYFLENPSSTTSTSLYLPSAIHTRSRLRRSKF